MNPALGTARVAYIDRSHERENYGVHSPGPAAYSPRQSLHRKLHQANSPSFTMRHHLKDRVRADGTTLRWIKACDGPGPGAAVPRVARNGGALVGDAPCTRFGTGQQCPDISTNYSPVCIALHYKLDVLNMY